MLLPDCLSLPLLQRSSAGAQAAPAGPRKVTMHLCKVTQKRLLYFKIRAIIFKNSVLFYITSVFELLEVLSRSFQYTERRPQVATKISTT